jgi:hypothetical protein
MRWLVACLLLVSATARAERIVIMEPPVVHTCRQAPSWPRLVACLAKVGKPQVVRAIDHVRLVRLAGSPASGDSLYLYVERGGQWQLGGMFDGGDHTELLAFDPLTVGRHVGYRLDIGATSHVSVSLDGVSSVPAVLMTRRAVLCSGDNRSCTDVTTACDVIVYGRTFWSFRGALTIEGNELRLVGERRMAGPLCTQAERVFLGWTQPS